MSALTKHDPTACPQFAPGTSDVVMAIAKASGDQGKVETNPR